MILVHKCPQCGADHIASHIVSAHAVSEYEAAVYLDCPKCRLPSCCLLKERISSIEISDFVLLKGDVLDENWTIKSFWPAEPRPNIPDLLPPDVVRVYLQAEKNFVIPGNEEAAGIMYGKALDIGLLKIDPALTGMLAQKIKKLAENGKITSDLSEWSHEIREIRNDATHEEQSITRDELIVLRNFTEMVLRYLFSLPNAVKRRRGEKLPWEQTVEAEIT